MIQSKYSLCIWDDLFQFQLYSKITDEDARLLLTTLDSVGFWSIEIADGFLFEAWANEGFNPLERIRLFSESLSKTLVQVFWGAKSSLGQSYYDRNMLEALTIKFVEYGVDVFRIYDGFYSAEDMKFAIDCVKRYQKHAQGTILFSPDENESEMP